MKDILYLDSPQVVGFNTANTTTLMNFLIYKIKHKESFSAWKNVKRNFIDIDDCINILAIIIKQKTYSNRVINIASPYFESIENIILLIEGYLNISANFTLENKGEACAIDITDMSEVVDMKKYFLDDFKSYINKILKKYY